MGGSGGGSSGAVSYPAYIQTVHGLWLDGAGVDVPANSLVDAINLAYGANPYLGVIAYNPDANLASMDTAVAALNTLIDAFSNTGDYTTAYNSARALITEETSTLDTIAIDNARLTTDINEHDGILTDLLEDQALPAFRAGLLNINAVQSSAFVVGEAILRAYKARDVAKYASELRIRLEEKYDDLNAGFMRQRREVEANHKIRRGEFVQRAVTVMITELLKRADLEDEVAKLTIEANRIRIVAKKEQTDAQSDFDSKEALWQPELFQFAQNLLSGPAGGVHQNQRTPSKAASAVGGALSGAAAGAVATGGNPFGAAAGAVLGVGLSLLQ